jgi:hypothetical protein
LWYILTTVAVSAIIASIGNDKKEKIMPNDDDPKVALTINRFYEIVDMKIAYPAEPIENLLNGDEWQAPTPPPDVAYTDQMMGFINALFAEYYPDQGDIDGATFQELAYKWGMFTKEIVHGPCGDLCQCAEVCSEDEFVKGMDCFRPAKWLMP